MGVARGDLSGANGPSILVDHVVLAALPVGCGQVMECGVRKHGCGLGDDAGERERSDADGDYQDRCHQNLSHRRGGRASTIAHSQHLLGACERWLVLPLVRRRAAVTNPGSVPSLRLGHSVRWWARVDTRTVYGDRYGVFPGGHGGWGKRAADQWQQPRPEADRAIEHEAPIDGLRFRRWVGRPAPARSLLRDREISVIGIGRPTLTGSAVWRSREPRTDPRTPYGCRRAPRRHDGVMPSIRVRTPRWGSGGTALRRHRTTPIGDAAATDLR